MLLASSQPSGLSTRPFWQARVVVTPPLAVVSTASTTVAPMLSPVNETLAEFWMVWPCAGVPTRTRNDTVLVALTSMVPPALPVAPVPTRKVTVPRGAGAAIFSA